ncbi:MAG TPA: TonB-dependent receptor [Steroidobacteraceae bacterium]|nr:TonB-dependent receptor [Steroidobacteraceae bacterium]
MERNSQIRRAVRRTLLMSAVAAATALPAQVQAQDEATIDTVVVTGSRIARPDFESPSPTVSVDSQVFAQTGTATVEQVINSLPQFVPSITNTSNNPSNGGQSNIDLRGLGSQRVLVLMDGRRIVPSNGSGIVDLNILPSQLVETVEIVSGGASAVYGSDAISGVVNFRLKKDFQGLELDGTWGQTSESDGQEYFATLTAGTNFAEDRGHIMGSVSYTEREEVFAGARSHSRVALGYDDPGFSPNGSPTFEEGRVTVAASQAARDAVFGSYGLPAGIAQATYGFNSDGTLFTVGDGTPGSVLNFKGDSAADTFNDANYTYNFAPANYLQLPLERTTAFAHAGFDVTESFSVYGQVLYSDMTGEQFLAPTPLSTVYTPPTNPFVPADLATLLASRADPNAPFTLTRRMTEAGGRVQTYNSEAYQVVLGFKGSIFDSWNYDVYGAIGNVDVDSPQSGNISREKWEELTFAPDGGVALCGGFNPFGAGAITQECVDYITVDTNPREEIDQTIFEATISGPVFDLPAGSVNMAFGAFYKEDEYAFIPDDALARVIPATPYSGARFDIAGFNAALPISGKIDSTEFFVEALVPVLKDMPGAKSLDVSLGYRYADMSGIGGVDSYKGELVWRPVEALSLRGSYQRAVRQPSVTELFQPQVPNFPAYTPPDPCSINSPERLGANAAAVRQLCMDQGIGAGLIDIYSFGGSQVQGLSGGNPLLTEETADTFTVGFVLRSPSDNAFLSGLSLTVDYWDIEIENAVGSIPARTFVSRCYDPAYNPTFDVNNLFCQLVGPRNTSSGQIEVALEANSNIGAYQAAGYDVQLDWVGDLGPGRARVNWLMTFLDKWDTQEVPGDAFTELAGTSGYYGAGGSFPEEKFTLNLGYDWAGFDVLARLRYVGEMDDIAFPEFKLDATTYVDLSAGYRFKEGMLDGLSLRAGVINLTDEDPVLFPSYQQSNTDPTVYDVLGQRYYFNVNYKF